MELFVLTEEFTVCKVKNYSKISSILADNGIGLFVVSTFNTDYVLIKKEGFEGALQLLSSYGYGIKYSDRL